MKIFRDLLFSAIILSSISLSAQNQQYWPEQQKEMKPWTRWWWMGSAVDKKNIREHLIEFEKAGLGGVEITPIYGAKGEEDHFLDFLSPEYLEILDFTIKTGDSLGLGVDMVLGTGWPYGGKQVSVDDAASKLVVNKIELEKGKTFEGSLLPKDEKNPVFLQAVVAFNEDGDSEIITENVKNNTELKWKAKRQNYTIYALFLGKTGQKVKRAAPGGAGFTLDHFSKDALNNYLKPFNEAFAKISEKPRAIFNDSYEVYGTDFTKDFLQQFEKRRGYNLVEHLDKLLLKEDDEIGNRVKSDFRETISDILLEEFDNPWTGWANENGMKSRLQAHGSPGNLIDLYAAADIPECETFGSMPFDIPGFRRDSANIRKGDADPVMLKFSSSAGHVAGRPLISSESFTLLREHFKTALSQTKPEAEELLLNGVNHMFLHGSTYSPERAGWPGWKFYASVNFSPKNTIWEDAPGLFSYLTNVQSMLQEGKADNENLMYWPIYDIWNSYYDANLFVQLKIHSLEEWLTHTSFYKLSTNLMQNGYGIDFISDRFIEQAKVVNGKLELPGGTFSSLIIPEAKFIPLKTMQKLVALKEAGANIIFEAKPESVPGFKDYESANQKLKKLNEKITISADVKSNLSSSNINPETLVKSGLKYIRRADEDGKIYFLVNHTSRSIDEFIPLNSEEKAALILDPLNQNVGVAETKISENKLLVKLQIKPGQSLLVKTAESFDAPAWNYFETAGDAIVLENWSLSFENGGPELPKSTELSELKSWTKIDETAANFSGTGIYETTFKNPDESVEYWKLDLGDVRESAQVWLNDEYVGRYWSVPFELVLKDLKEGENKLTVKVTNLAANRLRAKEMRGEEWKTFYEINMVNKDYEKFDATKWDPMPSGLVSPVKLIPLKTLK